VTAAVAAVVLLWASAFPGIRAALAGYGPGHLALLRFLVASAALGLYAWRAGLPKPKARDLPGLAGVGLAGVALYHVALNAGERTVTGGVASLLVSTVPVLTAVLAAVTLGERLGRRAAAGVGVSLSGAVRAAPPAATAAAVYLGLFPGALAYLAWAYALARGTASRTTAALYLVPPTAIVIEWLWLGDRPGPLALAGGAITLAGVALVRARPRAPAQGRPEGASCVKPGCGGSGPGSGPGAPRAAATSCAAAAATAGRQASR
jgi:drug/metabolite transporter (DMT)-like permease